MKMGIHIIRETLRRPAILSLLVLSGALTVGTLYHYQATVEEFRWFVMPANTGTISRFPHGIAIETENRPVVCQGDMDYFGSFAGFHVGSGVYRGPDDWGASQPVFITSPYRVMIIPYWFSYASSTLLASWAIVLVWRALLLPGHRAARGQCCHCGYDLRATPNRCPECGMMTGKHNRDTGVPPVRGN